MRIKIRPHIAMVMILILFITGIASPDVRVYADDTHSSDDTVTTGSALSSETEYTISARSLKLGYSNEKKLSVHGIVSGSGCTVSWSSSDKKIASVKKTGKVRAEKAGKTTVTAKVSSGSAVIAKLKCSVKVFKKKISYSKMKKKVKAKKNKHILYADDSKVKSNLTFFGLYRVWTINPGAGYAAGDETITLYPTITAKKSAKTSALTFDLKLSSIVAIRKTTYRKYKKITISGGKESFTISGKTKSKARRYSGSTMHQTLTKGTFRLSKDTKPSFSRLDKLKRILSSSDAKIKTKDTKHGRKYTFKLTAQDKKSLTSILKKYTSLLKLYGKS